MYGFDQHKPIITTASSTETIATVVPGSPIPTILPDGTDLPELLERLRKEGGDRPAVDVERSLGRVVFGGTGWDKWSNNPA